MYQKDFILFVIEQFARLIRQIVARILNQEHDDASFMIEQVYRQYLGLNSDLVLRLPLPTILGMLRVDPDQYADRCVVFANLLYLEARNLHNFGETEPAQKRLLLCIEVFESAQAELSERDGYAELLTSYARARTWLRTGEPPSETDRMASE